MKGRFRDSQKRSTGARRRSPATMSVVLVLAFIASSIAILDLPSPAPAEACPLQILNPDGTYRNASCTPEESDDSGGGGDSGGGSGGSNGPICWVVWEAGDSMDSIYRSWFNSDLPEDLTWWWNQCATDCHAPSGNSLGCGPVDGNMDPLDLSWSVPVPVEPGQSWEEHLLQDAWVEVEGQLDGPELELHPAAGEPAIVHVPVFVGITNPQDTVEHESCSTDGPQDICVGVTAEPSVRYLPLGDGGPVIHCDPEGTMFDPDGPDLEAQAQGACAHAYAQRSESGAAIPGMVEVEWQVSWYADRGNAEPLEGTFDPLALPAGDEPNAPRVVEEVHAVVDDIDIGGGSH